MAVFDSWANGNTFTASDEDAVAQAINGSGWLLPCHYATSGAESYTLSGGSVTQISGTTLDGGSPSVGDRILVKDAPSASGAGSAFSAQPANGVYEVTANSSNLSVSRVYEMSTSPSSPYFQGGAVCAVMAGTANGGLLFIVATPNNPDGSFTYGTNNIQWSPVGYLAGTGLVVNGATIELSSGAQADLALAASSLQSTGNVLTTSGSAVQVSSMSTGQIIFGDAGTPTIGSISGDISIGPSGAVDIVGGAVTLSKMANLASHSVIGNTGGSSATPTAVPLTSSGAASSIVSTDSDGNITVNAVIEGVTTTATAGGTTTLAVTSTQAQQFTGTATQTVILPNATACSVGLQFYVTNRSTAAVTVETNGGSTLQVMAGGSQCVLTLISNGSTAGTWDVAYAIAGLTGTVSTVSVVSTNGFAGSVATATSTPAITIETTVNGLLKGSGTGISAATSGTDYAPATSGSSILKGSGSGGFSSATSGTDYAPATSGTSALAGDGSGNFQNATLTMVGTPTSSYSMGGYSLTSLGAPSSSTDAATKGYVDTSIQGLSAKYSAVAATNTETLTITSGSVTQISGTTVNGISPNVNDYVLIMNAPASTGAAGGATLSTEPANGLYLVSGNSTNLTVSRATDMSGSINPSGAYIFVESGSLWAAGGFVVTTPASSSSFTYGTNNIAFTQFTGAGEIVAGTGISKSGTTLSVSLTGGTGISVSGATISVASSSIGVTQLSASGTASSGTYLRGDNSWQNFASAVGSALTAGTAITISGETVSVTGSSIGLTQLSATGTASSSTYLRGDNSWANLNTAVQANALSSMTAPASAVSWNSYGITSLANPVNAQDAATKIYADSSGYHPWCKAATTGTETFTISSGTVVQISGTALDGISPNVNDRILIKDAPASSGTGSVLSSQPANGLYVITGNTTNLTVARVSDMSSGGAVASPTGSAVIVTSGNANAYTSWKVTQNSSSFTYGTNTIQWVPDVNVANVLTRSGNTIEVSPMSTGQAIIGNAGTPTITTLSGDVTVGATGTTTIGSGVVSLAKQANLAANSVIGNTSGSSATPSAVSLLTTATAGAVALRDTNANLTANSFIDNMATTATAAGTTTLTVASAPFQQFTGSTTQTVVLPNATTLANGQAYTVANRSTGAVTVETYGGTSLQVVNGGTEAVFTLISNSGSAGTWDVNEATIVPVYTANVGDGSSTSYTITHNLGSRNLSIEVYDASTYQTVNCDKFRTTTNTVTLTFVTAPSVNAYVVVIIGGSSGTASVTSTSITDSTVTGRSLITAANALAVQNVVFGFTSTATAGSTTTLTVSSAPIQCFTGTSTQTVVLPTTSILAGMQFSIINESTGVVTVESSNASTVIILASGASAILTALVTTPTTPANWSSQVGLTASTLGQSLVTASSTSSAQTTLGASTVGASVFTASSTSAARTAIGATTTGSSLLTASSAANALAVMTPFQSAATAYVATLESTTSSTYADLATTTDTVTVTVGSSGVALVAISFYGYGSQLNVPARASVALSGANTIAASDSYSAQACNTGSSSYFTVSNTFIYTGLTAGSTTFKMKYLTQSGYTGDFQQRRISVIPL